MLHKLFLIDQLNTFIVNDIITIIKNVCLQSQIILIDPPTRDEWYQKSISGVLIKNDIIYKNNILFGFSFNPSQPTKTYVRYNKIYYRIDAFVRFKVDYKKYQKTHQLLHNISTVTIYNNIMSFYLIPNP